MWSGLKNALEMFHSFSMARPWSEGPLAAGRSDCVQAAEPNEAPSSATEAALRAENAQLRAMLHAARTESQYMSVQFRKLREKLLAPRVHPQIDPDPQVDPDPPTYDPSVTQLLPRMGPPTPVISCPIPGWYPISP